MQLTTTNETRFYRAIKQDRPANLQTKKLFVHVSKINRSPLSFLVNYYFRKSGEWVKYSTLQTGYSMDIIEDVKKEISIYHN